MDDVVVLVDEAPQQEDTMTEEDIIAMVGERLRILSAKWPEGRTLDVEPGLVTITEHRKRVTLRKYLNFCEAYQREKDGLFIIRKAKTYACTVDGVPRVSTDTFEELFAIIIDDFKVAIKGTLAEFS